MNQLKVGKSIRKLAFLTIIAMLGVAALLFAAKSFPASANTDRVEEDSKTAELLGSGRIMFSNGAGIYVINADPNEQQNYYTVAGYFYGNSNGTPSVSSQTGRIAFAGRRGSEGVSTSLIYAMDADGSNVHAVTTPAGLTTPGSPDDSRPVISPDGSKIAFISRRFGSEPYYPDGTTKDFEVFVVNFDGTGLHQVTSSEQIPSHPGSTAATVVAWNGGSLKVSAARGFTNAQGQRVTRTGIYSFNPDGTGETLDLQLGGFDLLDSLDASGGAILFPYANNDLYVGNGSNLGNYTRITAAEAGNARWAGGSTRFSPDGSRIVYSTDADNGTIMTIGIDGTGRMPIRTNTGIGSSKWWFGNTDIPTPARLTMEPSAVRVENDGVTFQRVVPTLLDIAGNVIFHAAELSTPCGSGYSCTLNPNNFFYHSDGKIRINNANNPQGHIAFCGSSGGLTGCGIVSVGEDVNFAEINSSVPTTNTNGAGGPGVFTIRRTSTQANSGFNVDFTLGGTAVRDVDYSLNVAGNSVLIPPGRTSVDIRVTPLGAAGNKTVSLNIATGPGATYITLPGRDEANINIVDNGSPSTTLTLGSITPGTGGNGGVVVSTLNGSNIASGASVKLTQAGQLDIPGANVRVAANGRSLTTVFDLDGRAIGLWNAVVTNPNTSIAQIVNGFKIEANSPARLTVQISGASEIRASHSRSRYDVVYTNHGNTDAFGVIVFITGVAPQECATIADANCTFLDTQLSDIPDLPGQPPFPAWVREVPNIIPVNLPNVIGPGVRQVGAIPILIPRIPANSSATFRFSMRFTSIGESSLQRLNAAILPPMVTAVTIPGAAQPTVATRAIAPEDANDDKNCIDAIFLSAINCALNLVPGYDCVRAGIGATVGVAQLASNISIQGRAAITPISGTQMFAAGVSVMGCLKRLTPLGALFNVIGCLAGFYDACVTCLGPDSCNPFSLRFVQSADPNEKTGVRRLTPQNYIPNSNLLYGISFENKPDATAPAQDVVITDQLDTSKLDVTTFELGQISFGDTVIDIPSGTKSFSTEVDLRPANDLLVSVDASLDQNTGLVTWTFQSLDPFTRQSPSNALAGFLPPNILGTEGAGKVLFTINPKSTVPDGAEIRNRATIVFDLNAPIDTDEWLNTLDSSPPSSQVNMLTPTQNTLDFPVSWAGNDTGSGVADYSVYVSDNGGPFTIWQNRTTGTTAMFTGVASHTYGFYSIAQDNASNLEEAPLAPDATTMILGPTAASVTISGRVLTIADGRGIYNARVTITDEQGNSRSINTGSFGYYRFEDVESGRTYVLTAMSKQFQFSPRVVSVFDNLTDIDLFASP